VKENPCFLESRQYHLRDALVLFGNETAHFLSDFVKLLPDRPAACIDASSDFSPMEVDTKPTELHFWKFVK
jgi:hypothetical protein